MKKRPFLVSLFAFILIFTACKKEKSFEGSSTPSVGSLKSDITGDCLPKTVAGTYEEGVELNGTDNFIEVQVSVTQGGSYLIASDTINGISFKATGVFTNSGLQMVKLKGSGTPFVNGISNFTIFYDTTACTVAVTTLAAGAGVPANFELSSSAGSCMSAAVAGDYVVGTPLNASNTATLKVNVTNIGTYHVTATTSNGITFTGTGTFGSTGEQNIVLTASGAPVTAGPTTIPVSVSATSSCSFILNVVSIAPTGDYYPRTVNSNWSYEFNDVFGDSLLINVIPETKTVGANVYNIFMSTNDAAGGFDSSGYYRKDGANYYEFINIGENVGFDQPQWMENIFLKDNVSVNSTWTSASFTGTPTGTTIPITLRLKYLLKQKDVTVVVKTISYPNTIEVEERLEVFNPVTSTWADASAGDFFRSQYAKNIGIITQEYISPGATDNVKMELRRSSVL